MLITWHKCETEHSQQKWCFKTFSSSSLHLITHMPGWRSKNKNVNDGR